MNEVLFKRSGELITERYFAPSQWRAVCNEVICSVAMSPVLSAVCCSRHAEPLLARCR